MSRTLTTLLAMALATSCFAEEKSDLAKGVVDPYDVGKQRAAFLTVAGVDSELDEKEFTADQEGDKKFAAAFDRWKLMVSFDKNKSGSLDWFETDSYRRNIRKRILGAFDGDKNNRLTGPEREKANDALTKGKIPALPKSAASSPNVTPIENQRPDRPERRDDNRGRFGRGDNDGPPTKPSEEVIARQKDISDHWNKFREEAQTKYDANGNGRIDGEEYRAFGEAMRAEQKRRINEKFDKNGNGEIDEDEREALRNAFRERGQYEGWKRHSEALEKYDTNKDGELSEEERGAAREARINEWRLRRYDENKNGQLDDNEQAKADEDRKRYEKQREERRAEIMKKYDKNGDGELSEEERREAFQNERRRGGRGGPSGPGGRRPGGPGGADRPDRPQRPD